jgi:probable DNA metabolism protein
MPNEWLSKTFGKSSRQLLLEFEWEHGKPKKIDRLGKYLNFVSLYARDDLIEKVILQALKHGVEYIVNRASPEAEEFMRRYREVSREYFRLKEVIRLQEFGKMLVAEVHSKFGLEMMLAAYFKSRYKREIVILSRDKAYMLNGSAHIISRDEFIKRSGFKPKSSDLWETFYVSQFIKGRRNKKYAMRNLPKKYWKQAKVAGHYINFGVNPKKLTDFF